MGKREYAGFYIKFKEGIVEKEVQLIASDFFKQYEKFAVTSMQVLIFKTEKDLKRAIERSGK